MALRNYINGAPLLTLTAPVDTNDVVLEVTSTAGYPAVPFTIGLERGTVNEEVVLCTDKTATTFTVTRGWDGTTGKNHSIGAAVEHTTSAADYSEANTHINSDADVHAQYVLKSAFSAKGRILVGTAPGTFAARAVGANNTVLVADSAEADGVKWSTVGTPMLADQAVTDAKIAAAVLETMIRRLAAAPADSEGRVYFNTSNSRWYGYRAGWKLIPFGAGQITISNLAPGAGVDGDIWFRY